jgi:3-methylcrotonyl-CoA carboxylase alpha subunit
MFGTILVANRGEIAVRIMRACRELGIRTVAVYSDADRFAYHTRVADVAIRIGPAPAGEGYLHIPAIIQAARETGAEAIHPGYGFLSENAEFAEACAGAGIVFIGPPPEAIRLMGSKIAAKAAVEQAGVPIIPGYQGAEQDPKSLAREAKRLGFPVMIKAAAGGGGKGMRAVETPEDFPDALAAAQREALAAFGNATVFLEKLIVRPRHIEFQILADQHGRCLHLGERECSIQRRHQKVIEEAPSAALTPELRAEMGAVAVRAAQAAGYVNAGTVEFMLDGDGRYYFLEMNTRLQVEHPVTELVSGRDLVHWQIAIAAGMPLTIPDPVTPRGHAIEVRLYAEDPATGLPATGTALALHTPHGPGIRLDAGLEAGDAVGMWYDPMLAKLIVWGDDRALAVTRLQDALADLAVLGLTTNLPLLRRIAADERFISGETYTDFLSDPRYTAITDSEETHDATWQRLIVAAAAFERDETRDHPTIKRSPWAAGALRSGEFTTRYAFHDEIIPVTLHADPHVSGGWHALVNGDPVSLGGATEHDPMLLYRVGAAMTLRQGICQARFWAARDPATNAILVTDGQVTLSCAPPRPLDIDVAAHGSGGVVGGMRSITAPMAGTIIQVRVQPGDHVAARQTLVIMSAMKMEHSLTAPSAAIVRSVHAKAGDVVTGGAALVELEAAEDI